MPAWVVIGKNERPRKVIDQEHRDNDDNDECNSSQNYDSTDVTMGRTVSRSPCARYRDRQRFLKDSITISALLSGPRPLPYRHLLDL